MIDTITTPSLCVFQTLCNSFNVQRVVFLTDVEGVYDKPPNEDGKSVLPRVTS